jgi:hypothetical protein
MASQCCDLLECSALWMAALRASLPGLEALKTADYLCQQERNMMDDFS